MVMKIKNTDIAVRILLDRDIDISIFKENILRKESSLFGFRLKLAGCQSEQEVENLINEYV